MAGTGFSFEGYIEQRLRDREVLLMTHMVIGYHPDQDTKGLVTGPNLKHEAFDINRRMMELMKEADIDLIELQMPFSEPIADGPAFVAANHGAIKNEVTPDDYFGMMQELSAFDIPLIAMGYYNWPLQMGHAAFARRLSEAGGHGYIMADLPPEIDTPLREECEPYDITPILIMTPTNGPGRLSEIATKAKGFVYCQARKGTTGRKTEIDDDTLQFIDQCKAATDERVPLGLGFGIATGEDVMALRGKVAVAIVGTALLRAWQDQGENGFREILQRLNDARR